MPPFFCVQSPWAREGGSSHYAHLGAAGAPASGRAEARPHARGSRLDVHTELFGYMGASGRTYRIVCLSGNPFGAQKVMHSAPHASNIPEFTSIRLLDTSDTQ